MRTRVITGRHVLVGALAFFAIVLAANAAFVVLALDSFTGLSVESPYERGLAYNETLRQAAAQRALGWTAKVAFDPLGGGRGRLEVALTDRGGRPIEDLRVSGEIRRPAHAGFDRPVTLERSAPGRYASDLELPLRGQWEVRLRAESRHGHGIRIEERIWLR